MENIFQPRPLHRLIPRMASRGAQSETFKHSWVATENPDEVMEYLDVVSLFPSVARDTEFPIEDYKVRINPVGSSKNY